MAGDSKGDNKFFQIVMVVITTIIAPVSVYFITHSINVPSNQATALPATSTLSSPVNGISTTATAPVVEFTPTRPVTQAAATHTALPTTDQTTTAVPTQPTITATPAGIANPTGLLPAGEKALAGGFTVTMELEDAQRKDGFVAVQLHLRNLTAETIMFEYAVRSVTVKEDGRTLEAVFGEKRGACSKKDLETARKIELAPGQEIVFQSVAVDAVSGWCGQDNEILLPLYKSPAKGENGPLIVSFENFGPFKGFGFQIEE